MSLNPRQERFAQEYVKDFNSTQAAVRAGYSERTAYSQGQRLLKNVEVQSRVESLMQEATERNKVTIDQVINEYAKIAFNDPRRFFHADGSPKAIHELDADAAACLSGLDVEERLTEDDVFARTKKYKLLDKKGALDSLMRYFGGFSDRVQLGADDTLASFLQRISGETAGLPSERGDVPEE